MERLEDLVALLSQPKKITITTHQKPDGDAMGSSLGLYNFLIQLGHDVQVVTPTDFPDYFKWMPGCENVWNYEKAGLLADQFISKSDIVFCLDFNALKRIEPMDIPLNENKKLKFVLIDHHIAPDDFADFQLWRTSASSTCELVFDFIELMGKDGLINTAVAECLYTGLLTDTGGFSNNATSSSAHRVAASLIDKGADIQHIQQNLNQGGREGRLRFIGNALLNKMTLVHDLGLAYIVVDKSDARRFNLQSGDTEGLVNYGLEVKHIQISALIKEDPHMIKLSFRSKGDISVNDLCRKYFNGGGHRNAAGGRGEKTIEATIEKIIASVTEFLNTPQ